MKQKGLCIASIGAFISVVFLILLYQNQNISTLYPSEGIVVVDGETLKNQVVKIEQSWDLTTSMKQDIVLVLSNSDDISLLAVNMKNTKLLVNHMEVKPSGLNGAYTYDFGKNNLDQQYFLIQMEYTSNGNPANVPYGILIGDTNTILSKVQSELGLRILTVGFTLASFLFSLLLFVQKKDHPYLLFLALLSLTTSLRTMYNAFPDLQQSTFMSFLCFDFFKYTPLTSAANEYAQLFLIKYLTGYFRFKIYEQFVDTHIFKRKYIVYLNGMFAILFIAMIFDLHFYFLLQIYYVIISFVEMYLIVRSRNEKPYFFRIMSIAISLMFAFRLFDICSRFGWISHGTIDMQFRLEGFIESFYSLAFQISIHTIFANKYQEANDLQQELVYLNQTLETQVEVKTQELQVSYALLKAEHVKKNQFMTSVIHNLKTPLFSLGGYTDMALDSLTQNPNESERYLGIVNKNIDTIQIMLEKLFFFMRLEDGEIQFHNQSFDIVELIEDIYEISKVKTIQKEISCSLFQQENECIVIMDQVYIQQALQNIVDNAIEHTPKGGLVEIKTTVMAEIFVITITDNGEGIPQERLPKIFERYYSYKVNGRSSSGIGLTMTKEIIQHYQGEILVESEEKKGTTFTIILPCTQLRTT